MSPSRFNQALWGVIALGTVARVVIGYASYGETFDIGSYELVHTALANQPLDAYSALNTVQGDVELSRWPYPPGFFPWIEVSAALTNLGLPLHGTIHLPAIAADAAIAFCVQLFLAWHGASFRTRLIAAGAVALGPSFAAISGYHGQIDSLAILFALGALMAWERRSNGSRAVLAGILIGIGAAVKTVPLLMLVALLPTSRSPREAATLVACAVAVPVAVLAPFAVADPEGVRAALGYSGVPGLGGLSLAIEPSLAIDWLERGQLVSISDLSAKLNDLSAILTLGALTILFAYLMRRRTSAPLAAVLLWLTVFAFSPNFFLQYLVWGLPFFLAAGFVKETIAVQAVVLIPTLLVYNRPWDELGVAGVFYVLCMLTLLACWFVALGLLVRGGTRGYGPQTA